MFGAAVDAGNWLLVLVGVLASVVAAYFYLRVVVLMYMRERRRTRRPAESGLRGGPAGCRLRPGVRDSSVVLPASVLAS